MTTISHSNFKLHELLTDQGAFVHTHYPESFADEGDAESGPHLVGGPAFDVYQGESHEFIIDSEGNLAAQYLIDWDKERFFADMTNDQHEEEQDNYVQTRRTGEDFIVKHRDEDGNWYACCGFGWTNDMKEAWYFTRSHAEQKAAKFNEDNKYRLCSKASVIECCRRCGILITQSGHRCEDCGRDV